jgi:hypothetical protein
MRGSGFTPRRLASERGRLSGGTLRALRTNAGAARRPLPGAHQQLHALHVLRVPPAARAALQHRGEGGTGVPCAGPVRLCRAGRLHASSMSSAPDASNSSNSCSSSNAGVRSRTRAASVARPDSKETTER